MRILLQSICAFTFLLNALVAQGQKVNLQFVEIPPEDITSGNFEVILSISGTYQYSQGGFNIRFTYDTSALAPPTIIETYNFDSAPYSEISLTYNDDRVSVNGAIQMGATATPVAVQPDWTDVLKLRFKILDENKTSNLVFLSSSETIGTVVFNHDNGEQLETGELYNLDAPLSPQPLPVSYITFKANRLKNNQVKLEWETATEERSREFQVQRSQDGKIFENIASVAASGSSTYQQKYSVVDSSPRAGFIYYRLKQVDTDGNFNYSKVVTVKESLPTAGTVVAFGPNPIQQKAFLSINGVQTGEVQLTLTDLSGKLIKKERITTNSGISQYEISEMNSVARGVYLVNVTGAGVQASFKVIKE